MTRTPSGHPAHVPPVEQWPILTPPDCPNCGRPADVVWIGPATTRGGAQVNVWRCRACAAVWTIAVTCWPVNDGPGCPYCHTTDTTWATYAPEEHGDLWLCRDGHEFVLTAEGLIVPRTDAP